MSPRCQCGRRGRRGGDGGLHQSGSQVKGCPIVADGVGGCFHGLVEQVCKRRLELFRGHLDPVVRIPEREVLAALLLRFEHLSIGSETGSLRAVAELVFLPAYSPDYNPIELAFAGLKALLSQAAERNIECIWDAIERILDTFSPTECRNYFKAAGYDPG